MSRRTLLLLLGLAVVLIQLLLMTAVWIPAPHDGGDNAGYVALAHALLSGEGYVELWDPARPLHTKYPPLFPALLAGAMALGAKSWTALKLVPAAATTVAVVLAYLWAARRRSPLFGAGVAVLLAASSGILWYSHWVLSDVPFTALTLLALVALERSGPAPGDGAALRTPWLAVGLGAAILAYFTRSAGLPLLVAVAAWLALRRRGRALAAFVVVAGVPMLLWYLRGRGGGVDYVGEFWMVDPYDPARGTVGLGGLVTRAVENAVTYATYHVPQGVLGAGGGVRTALGLLLLAAAAVGWGMRFVPARGSAGSDGDAAARAEGPDDGDAGTRASRAPLPGVHVAELFLPLYAGLILLWPQVWSGDRFALPLFALLLFYAGDAVVRGAARLSRGAAVGAGIVAFLAVAAPSMSAWSQVREGARACTEATRAVGSSPYACHGPRWTEFVDAARWAGANLPAGSAVLSRKPRIFYVMGGVPSRTYPFTTDVEAFLAGAREAGAEYVVLDALGAQGPTYVGGAVQARPEAFCSVASFASRGQPAAAGTQLLGIVDPASGLGGRRTEGRGVGLPSCPPPMAPEVERTPPPFGGLEIPLLTGPARQSPAGSP